MNYLPATIDLKCFETFNSEISGSLSVFSTGLRLLTSLVLGWHLESALQPILESMRLITVKGITSSQTLAGVTWVRNWLTWCPEYGYKFFVSFRTTELRKTCWFEKAQLAVIA